MKPSKEVQRSLNATSAYQKRFGQLHVSAGRTLGDWSERARKALKAGKPDPDLEQFKEENFKPNVGGPNSLLPGEPNY